MQDAIKAPTTPTSQMFAKDMEALLTLPVGAFRALVVGLTIEVPVGLIAVDAVVSFAVAEE